MIVRREAPDTQAGHWARRAEMGSLLGMRILYQVARRLGRWPFRAVLAPVIAYFFLTQRQRRAASRTFLARVRAAQGLPPPSSWLVFRHFWTQGEGILERVLTWDPHAAPARFRRHGREAVAEVLDSGRGILLIGSHLGNIEVARNMSLAERKAKVNVLVHTAHNPRYIDMMRRINPASQASLYQVAEITPATAMELKGKIDAGEVVLIAADRVPLDGKGIAWAPFLGHDAPWPIGPYVLASVLECPVFLFFCFGREGHPGEYDLHYEPFAERVTLDRATRRERLGGYARRYAERLAHYCTLAPLHWGNVYDFWADPSAAARVKLEKQGAR